MLIELGRWGGANAPPPTEDMCMSVDAHVVSLRTLFDPERAGDFAARVVLHLGACPFVVEIADGRVEAGYGEAPEADAAIETDPATLIGVLHGHRTLDDALAAGDLRFEGDEQVVRRFSAAVPAAGAGRRLSRGGA